MKKIIISLLFFVCAAVLLCACQDSCARPPEGYCVVDYYIDGEIYSETYSKYDEITGMPDVEPREGYVFKGWYLTEEYIEKWDFENNLVKGFLRLYGYWVPEGEETFNVLFYDVDGELITYQIIQKGGKATFLDIPEIEGYEFVSWMSGNFEFDFTSNINSDIILKAKFVPINYTITFVADGEIVDTKTFNAENTEVVAPDIPQKEFYQAKWESYKLKFEDMVVNAVYTPINYKLTFIADGEEVDTYPHYYTVEDKVVLPHVPNKEGYTGEWDGPPLNGGDATFTAVYTPIVYTITFRIDGIDYIVLEYTVETRDELVFPTIPDRPGLMGDWERFSFRCGNIVVNAVYTPKVFTATFVADGSIVGTVNFQYDDMNVYGNEPAIPQKAGYTAHWQDYTLEYKDITINAVYTPIEYTATFKIKGETVGTSKFTVEYKSYNLPNIEEWHGYSVTWEDVPIQASDITINGILTPITYYVIFIADDIEISRVGYTVESYDIEIPEIPPKEKHTAKWPDFSLTFGEDVKVYAIYTPISDEELNFKDEFTYIEEDDGSLTVESYYGKESFVYVPSQHDGMPVKAIGKQAFSASSITGIKLGEGIERISDDAFMHCEHLYTVQLPESLRYIGKNAFAFCVFTNIVLPNGITEIDELAFYDSALTSIVLPKNLETLTNCFSACENLNSLILNTKLKVIKGNAFVGCTSLKELDIPKNVEIIEALAFSDSSVESVHFEDIEHWKIYSVTGEEQTNMDISDLSDDTTAALWLTKVYLSRVWKNSAASDKNSVI